MRTRAAMIPAVLLLIACGQAAPSVASSSTAPLSPAAGTTPTQITTPATTPTSTPTIATAGQPVTFGCQPAPGSDPLVLAMEGVGGANTYLTVLDVANPTQPRSICDIRPTAGGRFLSNGQVAFWTRDQELGTADLATGTVTITGHVSHVIGGGAFSRDGSVFAYRSTDPGGTLTLYMHYLDGSERLLLSRPPVGGHGGPVGGPTSALSFSPDGQHLLSYDLFITPDDPTPHFEVFSLTGTVEMKGDYSMGTWSPSSGASLFYLRPAQPGRFDDGDIYDWTPGVADGQLYAGVPSYDWPTWVSGAPIYFTAYDGSGYPHLWVIGRFGMSQVSTTQSSHPFVVGGYVWSDQERPCQCGPGGNSTPTGKVVARNTSSGVETVIDLPLVAPYSDPIFPLLDYRGP